MTGAAIVTGGASGIGVAVGRALARRGHHVVLADVADAAAVGDLVVAPRQVRVARCAWRGWRCAAHLGSATRWAGG